MSYYSTHIHIFTDLNYFCWYRRWDPTHCRRPPWWAGWVNCWRRSACPPCCCWPRSACSGGTSASDSWSPWSSGGRYSRRPGPGSWKPGSRCSAYWASASSWWLPWLGSFYFCEQLSSYPWTSSWSSAFWRFFAFLLELIWRPAWRPEDERLQEPGHAFPSPLQSHLRGGE